MPVWNKDQGFTLRKSRPFEIGNRLKRQDLRASRGKGGQQLCFCSEASPEGAQQYKNGTTEKEPAFTSALSNSDSERARSNEGVE
jgi:hypothetical protein